MQAQPQLIQLANILKDVVEQQVQLSEKISQRQATDKALMDMIQSLTIELKQTKYPLQQPILTSPQPKSSLRRSVIFPKIQLQNTDQLQTVRLPSYQNTKPRTRSSTTIQVPAMHRNPSRKNTLQMSLFNCAQRKQQNTRFFIPALEQQRTTVICGLENFDMSVHADYEEIKEVLELWVGELYYRTSELVYGLLDAGDLTSKEEMKMQFSKNLILNCVCLFDELQERYKDVWKENKEKFVQVMTLAAKKSLNFLMRKYPVKSSAVCINTRLERKIIQFDQIRNPENNSLSLAELNFDFQQDGRYDCQVKNLLNFYLKCCKKNYPRFESELKSIFSMTPAEIDDLGTFNRISRGSTYDPMKTKEDTFLNTGRSGGLGTRLQVDNTPRREIFHRIGMKFNKQTSSYSFQELKEQGISIKSSEVLRILIKWIQNLEKNIKIYSQGKSEDMVLPHKTLRGRKVTLTQKQIANLKKAATQAFTQVVLQTKDEEVNIALSEVHDCIKRNKYNFKYIPQEEVIVGLATAIVSDPVNKTIVGYLESLLHCILLTQQNFNQTLKQNKVSLMSFALYDLLRAKCYGSSEEINVVYSRLLASDVFEIIRVKNRMDSVNKDFLLNLRMIDTPLICELQLIVVSEQTQRQQKEMSLSQLSHFLYQLERSKFGPLVQAYIVSSYLNPTIPYFQSEIKKLRLNTLDFFVSYSKADSAIKVINYAPFVSRKSFSCNNCWRFVDSGESFIPSFQETRKYYPRRICYDCVMDRMDQRERKLYLTGELAPLLVEIKEAELYNIPDETLMYIFAIRHGTDKNGEVFRLFNHEKINYPKFIRSFIPYPNKIMEKKDCKFKFIFKFVNTDKIFIQPQQILPTDILPNCKIEIQQIKQSQSLIQTLKVTKQSRLLIDTVADTDLSKLIGQIQLIEYLKSDLSKLNDTNKNFMERRIQFLENTRLKLVELKLLYVDFLMFNKLQNLDISTNRIQVINFKDLKLDNLQQVNISCNELIQLDLSDCPFMNLKDLNVSHNRIKKVEFGKGQYLQHLVCLNLSHNRLQDFDFLDNVELNSLNCLLIKYNRVKQLNPGSWLLPNLEELNLKGNLIREAKNLNTLESLQSMVLGNNMIQSIDLSKLQMPNLKLLDLSQNRIGQIILLGSKLDSLQQLILEFNYLKTFEFNWITSPNLQKIILNFNLIQRMSLLNINLPSQCRIFASDNGMFKLKYDSFTKDSVLPQMLEPPLHQSYIKNLEAILNWYINRLTPQQLSEFLKNSGLIEMLPKWGYFIGHQVPPWMRYIYSDPEKNLYIFMKELIPHNQF